MINIRTCKVVTFNEASQEHGMWLIDNGHEKLLNKKNTQLLPMIVENYSRDDFGSHRHSYKRSYLFKRNLHWDFLKVT